MKKLVPLIILIIGILVSSCNDEINSIGLDLLGEELGNRYTDSTTVVAYSVVEDSISTKNLLNNVVGYVNDPVFGTTRAGIASQFLLSGNSVDFGDSPVLDSIVLCLKYTGYYGDTLSPVVIRVHELTEKLDSENSYFHNSEVAYDPTDLTASGNFTLYPKPNTSLFIDTATKESHIRIPLAESFGYHFLNNKEQMANASSFGDFFKGLYIVADPTTGTGNLSYVNMTSSLSGIQIFYTKNDKQYLYTLTPTSSGVRYNTFEHDFTQGESSFMAQVINTPADTALGAEKLYVQAGGGVTAKIAFPTIKEELGDQKVVINKAELVITDISENNPHFTVPAKLRVSGVSKSTGKLVYIPDDEVYTSEGYYGGTYNAETKEYRIRITKYIQQLLLNDEYQNHIYLKVSGAGIRGNRLILSGTNPTGNSDSRLRLEVSYTQY